MNEVTARGIHVDNIEIHFSIVSTDVDFQLPRQQNDMTG
jgi:hypothetical protein